MIVPHLQFPCFLQLLKSLSRILWSSDMTRWFMYSVTKVIQALHGHFMKIWIPDNPCFLESGCFSWNDFCKGYFSAMYLCYFLFEFPIIVNEVCFVRFRGYFLSYVKFFTLDVLFYNWFENFSRSLCWDWDFIKKNLCLLILRK